MEVLGGADGGFCWATTGVQLHGYQITTYTRYIFAVIHKTLNPLFSKALLNDCVTISIIMYFLTILSIKLKKFLSQRAVVCLISVTD